MGGRKLGFLLVAILAVTVRSALSQPNAFDLSGRWMFDTYVSDNPQQVSAAIRADLGQGSGELFTDDLFGGGRYGGGGRGRRGQGPGRGNAGEKPQPVTADDQHKIDDLTSGLRYPPPSMTVTDNGTTLAITDAQGQTRTFQISGKREKQTFESGPVDTTTTQEGPVIVSEYDLGKGRKMIYRYSIDGLSKQLVIKVTFERGPGDPGPFEIKQVYDRQ